VLIIEKRGGREKRRRIRRLSGFHLMQSLLPEKREEKGRR